MKKQHVNSAGKKASGAVRRLCLVAVAVSAVYAGCQKQSQDEAVLQQNEVVITEAGDNDLNMKGGAAASATPTGPATLAVYPVRAAHNTGYDSATQCAPSSWNCNDTYSNSDFIGSGSNAHYGIDIWGALNAPIAATVTGVVTYRGFDSGLGNTVVIREPSGWHHWLGHLNSIASSCPSVGSTVTAGTIIGYLGHTGSNSGGVNHLHMSINHGSGFWSTGQNFWGILNAKENNVCSTSPTTGTFDDFAGGVGRYTRQPTYSGSTVGVATTSSATHYVSGSSTHLKVTLNDNTSSTANWFVRLLSGDGIASNNVATSKTGELYFWLKTSNAQSGAQARIWVDDSDGTEQSAPINIINDGAWHRYTFNLATWSGVGAVGGNGAITANTVTLDAIILSQPNTSAQWVAYIDDVGN